jgi:hypothetical protein
MSAESAPGLRQREEQQLGDSENKFWRAAVETKANAQRTGDKSSTADA